MSSHQAPLRAWPVVTIAAVVTIGYALAYWLWPGLFAPGP